MDTAAARRARTCSADRSENLLVACEAKPKWPDTLPRGKVRRWGAEVARVVVNFPSEVAPYGLVTGAFDDRGHNAASCITTLGANEDRPAPAWQIARSFHQV